MRMKKYGKKELEQVLDDLRFYVPYGVYRTPVEVRGGKWTRKEVVV